MKLIDNRKDYYDYLMGVYGIDTKVIYDRRRKADSKTLNKYDMERYFGTGPDNKWMWANEVAVKIGNTVYLFSRKKHDDPWVMPETFHYYFNYYFNVCPNPCKLSEFKYKFNDTAPIELRYRLASSFETYRTIQTIENPILKEFSFIPKHIQPDVVWQLVYDWITSHNEPVVIDTRTDIEHLQSAGFDKKTSFRNIK